MTCFSARGIPPRRSHCLWSHRGRAAAPAKHRRPFEFPHSFRLLTLSDYTGFIECRPQSPFLRTETDSPSKRTAAVNQGQPFRAKGPPRSWNRNRLHSSPDRKTGKVFLFGNEMKNAESQHTDGPGRGRSRAIRRIKSGIAGGRDGHLCPMGSLDPRRCATPQALAKLQTQRPLAA